MTDPKHKLRDLRRAMEEIRPQLVKRLNLGYYGKNGPVMNQLTNVMADMLERSDNVLLGEPNPPDGIVED